MKRAVVCVAVLGMGLGVAVTHAQELPGVPENIVNELGYLAGSWEFAGHIGDKQLKGAVSYKWAKGKDREKYGLVERWSYQIGDVPVSGVSVMGWNAAKKLMVESGFNSAGAAFLAHWSVKSPTEWRGEFSDSEDGKEVTGKGVIVKQGPGRFVYEGEANNGETARLVFEKVKTERKRAKQGSAGN